MLKKLFLLLFAFPFLFATSCSDDDNNTISYEINDIAGTWIGNGQGSGIGGVNDETIVKAIQDDLNKRFGENSGKVIIFNENKTCFMDDKEMTFSINGDVLYVTDAGTTTKITLYISDDYLSLKYDETEYYKKMYPNANVLSVTASKSYMKQKIEQKVIVSEWVIGTSKAKTVDTNNSKATAAIEKDITSRPSLELSYFALANNGKVYDDEDYELGTYTITGNKLTIRRYTADSQTLSQDYTINAQNNALSCDIDQTEFYKGMLSFIDSTIQGAVISKVITTVNYTKK